MVMLSEEMFTKCISPSESLPSRMTENGRNGSGTNVHLYVSCRREVGGVYLSIVSSRNEYSRIRFICLWLTRAWNEGFVQK